MNSFYYDKCKVKLLIFMDKIAFLLRNTIHF
jgi:hypothetical protein